DEEHAGIVGGGDGVLQRLLVAPAAPTVAGQPDVHALLPHAGGVVEGLHGVGGGAGAVGGEELQGHDLHVPVHARHADAIVADGADGAGDVGAVAHVVHGVAVFVGEVGAVDVVDVAVVVVVDAVAGHLEGVVPHVGGQVRVGVVDAAVEYAVE